MKEQLILKIIAEKGGRINKAKELARELDIAPQTVSYHLKELEKSGLVKGSWMKTIGDRSNMK